MKKLLISTLGVGIVIGAMGMTAFANSKDTTQVKDIDLNEKFKVNSTMQVQQTDQSVEIPEIQQDEKISQNNNNYRYNMEYNEKYDYRDYGRCHYGYYNNQE